jgi:hypothetical protein
LLYHFYSNILSIILKITLLLIYTHSYINQPSSTSYQKKNHPPKIGKAKPKKKIQRKIWAKTKKKKEKKGKKINNIPYKEQEYLDDD